MKRADGGESFNFLPLPFEFIHCRGESAALAAKCAGRSAGPEVGRGVSTPPSLPLDSTHPAMQQLRPPPAAETGRSCWGSGQQDASAAQGTKRMLGAATRRQGLLAPFRPQRRSRSGKMLAASLKAFFALLRFESPSAAAAAAPRRGAVAPSPSAPVGRIHLSQRERQEALPVCPWCPFKKEARSVPTTVLALPLGELANPKGLTERAKGSPFWRCKAPERGCAPECCPFSPLARMLPQGASASGCRLPLRPLP